MREDAGSSCGLRHPCNGAPALSSTSDGTSPSRFAPQYQAGEVAFAVQDLVVDHGYLFRYADTMEVLPGRIRL
jgi:hypothetical protein